MAVGAVLLIAEPEPRALAQVTDPTETSIAPDEPAPEPATEPEMATSPDEDSATAPAGGSATGPDDAPPPDASDSSTSVIDDGSTGADTPADTPTTTTPTPNVTTPEEAPLPSPEAQPTVGDAVTGDAVTAGPIPPALVATLLSEIDALGGQATPADLELARLLRSGEIQELTALADYLVGAGSLTLLGVVSQTLLGSGDLGAAQAIVPQLLEAGLTGHAVTIVQAVLANGNVASALPLVPSLVDALADAGETAQIAALLTQLLTLDALDGVLVDPANQAILADVLRAVIEAGQSETLGELVPGLVSQLLAAGQLQQVVGLVTALASSGVLASVPALLTQVVTPQLLQALLAAPASASLLTGLLGSLVQAGHTGVLGAIVPGLVSQLLAAGQLQQVVGLLDALAGSGALMAVPGLLTQLLTPQLLQGLLTDLTDLELVTDLLASVVQAIVAWSPNFAGLSTLLSSLVGQLHGVVDLIEELTGVVQPLFGSVLSITGPAAGSGAVEELVAPVVESSFGQFNLTWTIAPTS